MFAVEQNSSHVAKCFVWIGQLFFAVSIGQRIMKQNYVIPGGESAERALLLFTKSKINIVDQMINCQNK